MIKPRDFFFLGVGGEGVSRRETPHNEHAVDMRRSANIYIYIYNNNEYC